MQLAALFILPIPVACISWTITHEEIFMETRLWCEKKSKKARNLFERRFFYVFTCEYCFSHYVTLGMLLMTKYSLLYSDWRGYIIAGFSIVWIANIYMSLYSMVRTELKKENLAAKLEQEKLNGRQ